MAFMDKDPLFDYAPEDESEICGMESDDENSGAAVASTGLFLHGLGLPRTFDIHEYMIALNRDPQMKSTVEIYQYCVKAKSTYESYRNLRKLSVFKDLHWLPLNFKDLKKKVARFVESVWGGMIHNTANVPSSNGQSVPTPYLSIMTCLRLWLSVPSILAEVRRCTARLPENIISIEGYEKLLRYRHTAMERGCEMYELVLDGTALLENLKTAIPLFNEEVLKAQNDGIEILVCHFGLWEDQFQKCLQSLVVQDLFCISLGKFLNSTIASLMMLLME